MGVNIRLMVFNPSGDRKAVHEQTVLVNPEIIEEGGPRRDFEEGCLSFPQMFANVEVCLSTPRRLHCFGSCSLAFGSASSCAACLQQMRLVECVCSLHELRGICSSVPVRLLESSDLIILDLCIDLWAFIWCLALRKKLFIVGANVPAMGIGSLPLW